MTHTTQHMEGETSLSKNLDYKPDLLNPTLEHRLFRQSVREFAVREIRPQAKQYEDSGEFNHGLYGRVAEQGYLGLTLPEKYGGTGWDSTAAVILYEELGKEDAGFAMSVLASAILFGHNLAVNGSEVQKETYLPRLVTGDIRGGIGITTSATGSDALATPNRAEFNGYHWVLNGGNQYITNFDGDNILVYARTFDEREDISLFLVDLNSKGVSRKKEERKHGMNSSPTGTLYYNDVHVPEVIGEVNYARIPMMKNLEIERITLAAISTGLAMASLEEMLSYSQSRNTFGQPIIDHQQVGAIHLAQPYAETWAARALLYHAASEADRNPDGRNDNFADAAKLVATLTAERVTDSGMKVHGGLGICGHKTERDNRASKVLTTGGGTPEILRNNIIKYLKKFGLKM